MQLKKSRHLALALTQASAALLGGAAHAEDNGWQVDTAALFYKEADGRVQATEPVVNLKNDDGEGHVFNFKAVVDALTGASPNGAAPANVVQTFTGPSGSSSSQIAPGALPLDTSFKDQRIALSANWQQPYGERSRLTTGGNFSSEHDFLSLGGNVALATDFNNKNTTLTAGLGLELDSISPVGGAPQALSLVNHSTSGGESEGEGGEGFAGFGGNTRSQADLLLGITQVLGRHALVQLNYGVTASTGYHSDPYKMLSVLDSSYNLIPAGPADTYQYLYEKRPDSRLRQSLYGEWKYIFTEDVIDLSYHYTSDDWGVKSSTWDAKYRLALGEQLYLEPHYRQYTQTAADFYQPYLLDGRDVNVVSGSDIQPLLQYASADPRLGAFDARTVGLKLGYAFDRDSEVSLRVEKYDQTARGPAAPTTGNLAGQKLMPDLSATWVQLGYTFRW